MGKLQTLTYQDYAAMTDGGRYQLIDGELLEMAPSPSTGHQWAGGLIFGELYKHRENNPFGEVLIAPCDVILAPDTVLQPDVSVVLNHRTQLISTRGIEGAPNIVVEVLSPSSETLDRGRKAELYYRYGVEELWLVDPAAQCVEHFERGQASFTLIGAISGDQKLETKLLPGFSLTCSKLFRQFG